MKAPLLCLTLAACGRPDCAKAVAHGMDLATAELDRSLAGEAADWRERARREAERLRAETLARCRDRSMTRASYDCTMAAKTYEELLKCPGWR